MDKQTAKLIARISENLPNITPAVMQLWIDNPRALQDFLRGLFSYSGRVEVFKPETEINTLIKVDRSLKPKYPESWGEPARPELEGIGPSEYDISRVDLWLHYDQMDGGFAKGYKIYEYLSRHDLFKDCLGYDDALMIQRINPISFRRLLGLNAILCWRSVMRNVNGNLSVPALYDLGGEIKLSLIWLSENFNNLYPSGRYPR